MLLLLAPGHRAACEYQGSLSQPQKLGCRAIGDGLVADPSRSYLVQGSFSTRERTTLSFILCLDWNVGVAFRGWKGDGGLGCFHSRSAGSLSPLGWTWRVLHWLGLGFIKKLWDFGTTDLFSQMSLKETWAIAGGREVVSFIKIQAPGSAALCPTVRQVLGSSPDSRVLRSAAVCPHEGLSGPAEQRGGLQWQWTEMVHTLESLLSKQEAQLHRVRGRMKKGSLTNVLAEGWHRYPYSIRKKVPCPLWHRTCPGRGKVHRGSSLLNSVFTYFKSPHWVK